ITVSKETYYSVKRDLRIEPLSQDHSVTFNPFFFQTQVENTLSILTNTLSKSRSAEAENNLLLLPASRDVFSDAICSQRNPPPSSYTAFKSSTERSQIFRSAVRQIVGVLNSAGVEHCS
ncbi:MAG: hypothetical protein ACK55Z_28965, partial [bacterium]